MKAPFFAMVAVALLATSAQAGSKYFVHKSLKGKDAKIGEWNIDYVQMTPVKGQALTANQIKINRELEASA